MHACRVIAAAVAAALIAAPPAAGSDRPAPGVTEVAPDGTVTWVDPVTGQRHRLQPAAQTADRPQCREYTAPAIIDGREVQTYGTVCRRPGGTWQFAN